MSLANDIPLAGLEPSSSLMGEPDGEIPPASEIFERWESLATDGTLESGLVE